LDAVEARGREARRHPLIRAQYNTRQSPRTVGFGVRVTGHAGVHEPAGGAMQLYSTTRSPDPGETLNTKQSTLNPKP